MYSADKREEFIELRGSGVSLDKIAVDLNISRQTVIRWDKQYRTAISKMEKITLDSVVKQYAVAKEYRVKRVCEHLSRIESELSKRDLSNLDTADLFQLYMVMMGRVEKELEGVQVTISADPLARWAAIVAQCYQDSALEVEYPEK